MKSKWDIVRLGDYISEVNRRNKNNNDIEVFSVTNSHGFTASTDYFSKEIFSKNTNNYKIVHQGEFAYNPSRINVGSVDYLRNVERVLVSPLYVVFKTCDELHSAYLKLFLKSKYALAQIRNRTTGSVRQSLKYTSLQTVRMPLPPVEYQLELVSFVARIDKLISRRKESLQLLENLAKSMFLQLFGNPIKNERGWKVDKLENISQSRLGKMRDEKKISGASLKSYLGNSNVRWFSFDLSNLLEMDFNEEEQARYSLEFGDLLVCEGGEIGRCAIWREQRSHCYFQKALHRVRVDRNSLLPEYLQYVFFFCSQFNGFKGLGTRATIAHLTGEKLRELRVPIPDLNIQKKFAYALEKIEYVKLGFEENLAALEDLRASFFENTVLGRIKFNDCLINEANNDVPVEPSLKPETFEFEEFSKEKLIDLIMHELGVTFTFSDIRRTIEQGPFREFPDYELIRSNMYALMDGSEPFLSQFFDPEKREIRFRVNL